MQLISLAYAYLVSLTLPLTRVRVTDLSRTAPGVAVQTMGWNVS
jgi:hypothetical protein